MGKDITPEIDENTILVTENDIEIVSKKVE
jgi:hypothetical protein